MKFCFLILKVGAEAFEQAASGGGPGGGPFEGGFNPFEEFFRGGGMGSDVCFSFCATSILC